MRHMLRRSTHRLLVSLTIVLLVGLLIPSVSSAQEEPGASRGLDVVAAGHAYWARDARGMNSPPLIGIGGSRLPPSQRRPGLSSRGRKIAGGIFGAVGGFLAGGLIGSALDRNCVC